MDNVSLWPRRERTACFQKVGICLKLHEFSQYSQKYRMYLKINATVVEKRFRELFLGTKVVRYYLESYWDEFVLLFVWKQSRMTTEANQVSELLIVHLHFKLFPCSQSQSLSSLPPHHLWISISCHFFSQFAGCCWWQFLVFIPPQIDGSSILTFSFINLVSFHFEVHDAVHFLMPHSTDPSYFSSYVDF